MACVFTIGYRLALNRSARVVGGHCRGSQRAGREKPVGTIDRERLNAWGGSLSLGHPFGATGARLVTNCCHRMDVEDAQYGLIAACAAGAIGIGLVLERVS